MSNPYDYPDSDAIPSGVKSQPTPNLLTREQVEAHLDVMECSLSPSAVKDSHKNLSVTDAALRLSLAQRDGQIDKLATYILSHVPGEPSQNEGVVDTAIRVLAQQAQEIERLKTMSMVEMMCENANVDAHVLEWEARCLKAESVLAAMTTERDEAIEEMLEQQDAYVKADDTIQSLKTDIAKRDEAIKEMQATLAARETELELYKQREMVGYPAERWFELQGKLDAALVRIKELEVTQVIPCLPEHAFEIQQIQADLTAAVQRADQAEAKVIRLREQLGCLIGESHTHAIIAAIRESGQRYHRLAIHVDDLERALHAWEETA